MEKIRVWLVLALFVQGVCAGGAGAGPFDEIVVFGDSLSDNGNLFFSEFQPKPDPALYYQGRLSNGPVWVEYLASPQRLNAPLDDRAYGGAQTSGLAPPGVAEQVAAYLVLNPAPLSAATLFILWGGGNDFLNGAGDAPGAVANIGGAMGALAQSGARHLLILNLPDLGAIPDTLNTPEAAPATAYTLDFNARLAALIDQFSSAHPGVQVYETDVFGLFQRVRASPAAFGFVNVSDPSPNFAVPDAFDSLGYLFWDDVHPTTEMHAQLAAQVQADLSQQAAPPAPEDSGSSACFIGALGRGV